MIDIDLDEQMVFIAEVTKRFEDLDKKFSVFEDYDNLYAAWAAALDNVYDSLGRLKGLEK